MWQYILQANVILTPRHNFYDLATNWLGPKSQLYLPAVYISSCQTINTLKTNFKAFSDSLQIMIEVFLKLGYMQEPALKPSKLAGVSYPPINFQVLLGHPGEYWIPCLLEKLSGINIQGGNLRGVALLGVTLLHYEALLLASKLTRSW